MRSLSALLPKFAANSYITTSICTENITVTEKSISKFRSDKLTRDAVTERRILHITKSDYSNDHVTFCLILL